jgi:hypothetical protein
MGDGREREAAPQRLVGETEMTMERTGERTKRKGKGKAKKQGWRGMREEGGPLFLHVQDAWRSVEVEDDTRLNDNIFLSKRRPPPPRQINMAISSLLQMYKSVVQKYIKEDLNKSIYPRRKGRILFSCSMLEPF